jgi:hypothetical protein
MFVVTIENIKHLQSVELATILSKINLMPLQKKHYEKLIQNIMFQMSSLKKQFNEIEKNPKPGGAFTETIKLRKCSSRFCH